MVTFSPLLDLLADIPDPRRAEGKLYKLPHVLLFFHSGHRLRLQLISWCRHLYRRPPCQAERSLRADLAARTCAHRNPLHSSGP